MDIKKVVKELTLEEKAALCSGSDFWHLQGIKRLGIPEVMVTDGPCGLRKQAGSSDHLGLDDSVEAVCFPTPCAAACSFDREMLYEMGQLLGNECQVEDVAVLLGPAVNIKRTPLCGRNFEYYSEDPYVSGELAAAYIEGVQSREVGTSIKHFAANNQESARMTVSADMDERTLREMYLPAFETAVREAKPWTLMCSYNKLNGTYASENYRLLTRILREEWGYEGLVMSDWGAVHHRIQSLSAGLDLEMPSSNGANDADIIAAVQSGRLKEEILDQAVERILSVIDRYQTGHREDAVFDREADHQKAVEMAKECIVLLKNEAYPNHTTGVQKPVLPLDPSEKVLFVGEFAQTPRYQGGGSSHVHPHKVFSPLALAGLYGNVTYAKGFSAQKDEIDEGLMQEAEALAKDADKIVIFAGLPECIESESYDRKNLKLPQCQNLLIDRLLTFSKPVIVVLNNGAPVEMPWEPWVSAIVESYLCGEAVGEAQMEILYGRANPSGKLAETFPKRLQDTPAYINFPGTIRNVTYGEGIFVGYRYYQAREIEVLFPFGHGLSYTTFQYKNLRITKADETGRTGITVCVDVKNTGNMAGREIVQLYISDRTGSIARPVQELKQFASVTLAPGETKTVTMELDERAFSWYDIKYQTWYAADGEYEIRIGKSSEKIVLIGRVELTGGAPRIPVIDGDVTLGELLDYEPTRNFVMQVVAQTGYDLPSADVKDKEDMTASVAYGLPVECLKSYTPITNEQIEQILEALREIVRQSTQQ